MEFKLIVQPDRGLEFVTHSSHLPLMFTVVLVSEAYFWTPLVRLICAFATATSDKLADKAVSSTCRIVFKLNEYNWFQQILRLLLANSANFQAAAGVSSMPIMYQYHGWRSRWNADGLAGLMTEASIVVPTSSKATIQGA